MKKIRLHFANDSYRGPGKVVRNLSKGLKQLGLLEDASFTGPALHGFLQYPSESEVQKILASGTAGIHDMLFGPNLVVLPNEIQPSLLQIIQKMVVPSRWVHDLYRRFSILDAKHIDVWPVGIDTDFWTSSDRDIRTIEPISGPLKCLLYVKSRTPADVAAVQNLLSDYGIAVKILQYGFYQESELYSACSTSHFGVLLTNTESQGIAYMEMLSTDLPLFVFNYPWWDYDGKYDRVEATSVPYFDSRCGSVTNKLDRSLFEDFLDGVIRRKYSPRSYILEQHTLKQAAIKYHDIMARNSQTA
jgi:hypothetical protein